jgi:hypothetical protein
VTQNVPGTDISRGDGRRSYAHRWRGK